MNFYIVLIGDMKDSRALSEVGRKSGQKKLKKVLEDINQSDQFIISPPTVTLGDEFQIVYESADSVFQHIWKVIAEMLPIQMRFGLGFGSITTEINTEQAIGMDGPAFHSARKAIEMTKKQKQRILIMSEKHADNQILDLMNGSLQLINHEMNSWNNLRFKLLSQYSENHDYKDISKELGISTAAFYKNLESGAINEIIKVSSIISQLINRRANGL